MVFGVLVIVKNPLKRLWVVFGLIVHLAAPGCLLVHRSDVCVHSAARRWASAISAGPSADAVASRSLRAPSRVASVSRAQARVIHIWEARSPVRQPAPCPYANPSPPCACRIAPLSSQPKPSHRFVVVLRHLPALGIHRTESALRARDSLLGCKPVQLDRLGSILLQTVGEFVDGLTHTSLRD